jgi:tRNA(fMet)-specific endonuclease VapC
MPGSFLLDTNDDIWIAAHAQQYDLTLVTRDAHFSAIEGIKIEAW